MKYITLTNGMRTKVDNADFEKLKNKTVFTRGLGYAGLWQDGKAVYLHRLIMNAPRNKEVDHINQDKLDNRKQNLRLCTRFENARNVAPSRNNTSGYRGVSWAHERKKWFVQIHKEGKHYNKRFVDLEDAVNHYNVMARKLFGPFAYQNATNPAKHD